MKNTPLCCALAIFVSILIPASLVSAEDPLAVTGVGIYDLGASAPSGLSGIAYAGGTQYYAIEDSGAFMHPLTINLNSSTGAVTSASLGTSVTLAGTDLEGIAYNPTSSSVYVSDEIGATIKEYNLSGSNLSTVAVPDVFTAYRPGKSLESLTRQAGGQSLWTTSEEALSGTTGGAASVDDGPEASTSDGTIVRLQKFNSSLNPVGQWAYKTDALGGTLAGYERLGVSDLCVLPNGELLVLEREAFGGGLSFKNKIYHVDFTGATDVSSDYDLHDLPTGEMVSKTLLWQSPSFSNDMFEGICLGPELDDGSHSLLLIADGDDFLNVPIIGTYVMDQSLYALKLSGTIPEPASLALLLSGLFLLLRRRRKSL